MSRCRALFAGHAGPGRRGERGKPGQQLAAPSLPYFPGPAPSIADLASLAGDADSMGASAGRTTALNAACCASPSSIAPVHQMYGLVADVPVLLYGSVIGPVPEEMEPCPLRARQEGHSRRFKVIHGATGSAHDLCSRRSCERGHLLASRCSDCFHPRCLLVVFWGGDEVQGRCGGDGWLAFDAGLVVGEQPVEMGDGPRMQVGQVEWLAFLGVGDQVDDPW
jgi:hypothetical protein